MLAKSSFGWTLFAGTQIVITNPLWDILATGGPFIKKKHIKLGKPDTEEHYPSKGEGTTATAQSKERVFLTVL